MDGDEPEPQSRPLSVKLLEDGIYILSKSFKFKRPRGVRNLAWWGSERIELKNGYNINPNIVDEKLINEIVKIKKLGLSSKLIWSFRDSLGAGFYHKKIFRNKLVWSLFTKMINKFLPYPYPDMSQSPNTTYPLQINIDSKFLIIGGGISGLKIADELSKETRSIVILEGEKYGVGGYASLLNGWPKKIQTLYNKLRRKGIKVINAAVFQGFLEDAYIAYKYDTEQTIKIDADAIIIATGGYEIPPLFENNDLPFIFSLTTLLKLINKYGYTRLRKGVIIGGMGDLDKALDTLIEKGVNITVIYRNQAPQKDREYLDKHGINYVEEVEKIRTSDTLRVKKLLIHSSRGEKLNLDVDFVAYTPIVSPDKEVVAQLNPKYVFDTRLGGYIPLHNLGGEIFRDKNIYLSGISGGYFPIDTIEKYVAIQARYIISKALNYENYDIYDFADAFNEIKSRYKELYQAYVMMDAAYQDSKVYEYIDWENPPTLFEGDASSIFVCHDMDVLYKDIVRSYKELGMWRMEHIKRYTGLGTGVCQGRDCQLNAAIILNRISGKRFLEIGIFRSRYPVMPQTLESLAGVEE